MSRVILTLEPPSWKMTKSSEGRLFMSAIYTYSDYIIVQYYVIKLLQQIKYFTTASKIIKTHITLHASAQFTYSRMFLKKKKTVMIYI